jgi:hypothetical protein
LRVEHPAQVRNVVSGKAVLVAVNRPDVDRSPGSARPIPWLDAGRWCRCTS